jgi:anti-sigma factor RsiW
MTEPPPLSPADEAALAALADDRLSPDDRAELEARLLHEPALAAALAEQRAGLHAITAAAGSVSAPLALRSRVEALQREAAAPRRRRSWPRIRLLPAAGLGAAVAAALLIVVLAGSGPTVETVLAAAARPPVAAASLDPSQPRLLRDRVETVRFPNYAEKFGWQAEGTRADEFDGRDTRTVLYDRDGSRIAYTIVAGEALDWPEDAARTTREGVDLASFTEGGRTVVTWRRDGRTCVLSGEGVPRDQLLELAAWKGQGAVAF